MKSKFYSQTSIKDQLFEATTNKIKARSCITSATLDYSSDLILKRFNAKDISFKIIPNDKIVGQVYLMFSNPL